MRANSQLLCVLSALVALGMLMGCRKSPGKKAEVDVGSPRGAVVQLTAGSRHTCALFDTGAVRCWGNGESGQLGYGNANNIGDDEHPASAGDVNVGGPITQVAAGSFHTCVLLKTGAVRCWGMGNDGELGYGNTLYIGDDEPPASAGNVNIGGRAIQLTAGSSHTCALLRNGAVRCWGKGDWGQLGYGNTNTIGDDEHPVSAGDVNVGGPVTQVVAGSYHTCALLKTGAVRCWGGGSRLGYANRNADDKVPASKGDVTVGGPAIQIAAGIQHTCALLKNGAVRCWGKGDYGQLGYGNTHTIGDDEHPASAGDVNVGGLVTQVAADFFHTCALLKTGAVRCWGDGPLGQLGYGNTNAIGNDEHPASAGDVNVGGPVTQVVAGDFHTCALLKNGAVRCWGAGGSGQLGYGNTNEIGDDEHPASAGNVYTGGTVN